MTDKNVVSLNYCRAKIETLLRENSEFMSIIASEFCLNLNLFKPEDQKLEELDNFPEILGELAGFIHEASNDACWAFLDQVGNAWEQIGTKTRRPLSNKDLAPTDRFLSCNGRINLETGKLLEMPISACGKSSDTKNTADRTIYIKKEGWEKFRKWMQTTSTHILLATPIVYVMPISRVGAKSKEEKVMRIYNILYENGHVKAKKTWDQVVDEIAEEGQKTSISSLRKYLKT